MKKYLVIIISVLMILEITACGKNVDSTPEYKFDYGKSDIYSKADMDEAVELIKNEFDTWDGFELHSISYGSDECNSNENIDWMNELSNGNNTEGNFSQCIMFVSDFHSPVDKKEAEAFNPDEEYTNWQWWLARADGGKWQLMTWGY